MKPLQTQLIEWSPQALVLEATWSTPLPKPSDFLECHSVSGQAFFLMIDQVQLQAGHQAIRLQTTPTKGYPEFPLQQCHVLTGSEYLSRLSDNAAGVQQSIQFGTLTLGLNQLGQWIYIQPQAQDVIESMIQASLDSEKYVVMIAASPPHNRKGNVIEIGTQLSFSLQDIRHDRLVDALVSDFSTSIQAECSRFLHEQLSAATTLDDVIAAEAWKQFPYRNLLLQKLNALSPYFLALKSTAKKGAKKKSIWAKGELNVVTIPQEAPELQAILYECALTYVRLKNPDVLILGSPELSEKAVRHTLGISQAMVILMSEHSSPWADLVDDAIQVNSDDSLTLYGQVTGGVKVHVHLNASEVAVEAFHIPETIAPVREIYTTQEETNPFQALIEENENSEVAEEEAVDDWSLQGLVIEEAMEETHVAVVEDEAFLTPANAGLEEFAMNNDVLSFDNLLQDIEPDLTPLSIDLEPLELLKEQEVQEEVAVSDTTDIVHDSGIEMSHDANAAMSMDAIWLDTPSSEASDLFSSGAFSMETFGDDSQYQAEAQADSPIESSPLKDALAGMNWIDSNDTSHAVSEPLPEISILSEASASIDNDFQDILKDLSFEEPSTAMDTEAPLLNLESHAGSSLSSEFELNLDEHFDLPALDAGETMALDCGPLVENEPAPDLSRFISDASELLPSEDALIQAHAPEAHDEAINMSPESSLLDLALNVDIEQSQEPEEFISPAWIDEGDSNKVKVEKESLEKSLAEPNELDISLNFESFETDWSDLGEPLIIQEALDTEVKMGFLPEANPLPALKNTAKAKPQSASAFSEGQQLHHETYGRGVIQKVMQMYDDQVVLNIQFDTVGKRLLDPSLCDLKSLSTAP